MITSDILVGVKIDPQDKRAVFIHAAIHCIVDHGYAETTVRKIAKYAGVTPGLLVHYFDGKEHLIAETYRYLETYLLKSYSAKASTKNVDPVEILRGFFIARIEAETLNPIQLKVWVAFWSLTLTRSDMQHIHQGIYENSLSEMKDMLTKAYKASDRQVDAPKIHRTAVGILALFDGLWLEWSLNPTTFSVGEGLQIITEFVEGTTGLKLS